MHLGNGAITPECVAITLSAASAGLGLCAWTVGRGGKRNRSASEGIANDHPSLAHRVGMAAALGAFVFAAQAVNVPILPASSAHLVGGVLLAWALGPAAGVLTMAVVLAIQALLLGDGGTLALGANIINMGVVPAALVAIARRAKWLSGGNLAAAPLELAVLGALSALAVVSAAALIVVEVALFRSASELAGWTSFARQMLGIHLIIAVAEGAATTLLAAGLAGLAAPAKASLLRPAFAAAALAMVAALAIPFSSELPDAYERAAAQSGLSTWLN